MAGDKFHSIGEILRSRINTPLVWGILLLTLALTVLFYFSQKQQQEVYNRYIETLSDYKFFASRIMQKMERVRIAPETDPARFARNGGFCLCGFGKCALGNVDARRTRI